MLPTLRINFLLNQQLLEIGDFLISDLQSLVVMPNQSLMLPECHLMHFFFFLLFIDQHIDHVFKTQLLEVEYCWVVFEIGPDDALNCCQCLLEVIILIEVHLKQTIYTISLSFYCYVHFLYQNRLQSGFLLPILTTKTLLQHSRFLS